VYARKICTHTYQPSGNTHRFIPCPYPRSMRTNTNPSAQANSEPNSPHAPALHLPSLLYHRPRPANAANPTVRSSARPTALTVTIYRASRILSSRCPTYNLQLHNHRHRTDRKSLGRPAAQVSTPSSRSPQNRAFASQSNPPSAQQSKYCAPPRYPRPTNPATQTLRSLKF
jgi:hypothetical protein